MRLSITNEPMDHSPEMNRVYGAADGSAAAIKILRDRVHSCLSRKVDSGELCNTHYETIELWESSDETLEKLFLGSYHDMLQEWDDNAWGYYRDQEEDALKSEIDDLSKKDFKPDFDWIIAKWGDEDGIDEDYLLEDLKDHAIEDINGFTETDYSWYGSVMLRANLSSQGEEPFELMRALRIHPRRLKKTAAFLDQDEERAQAVSAFRGLLADRVKRDKDAFSYPDKPLVDAEKFAVYLLSCYQPNHESFAVDDLYLKITVSKNYIENIAPHVSDGGSHIDPANYLECKSGTIESGYDEFDLISPIVMPLKEFRVAGTDYGRNDDAVFLSQDHHDFVRLAALARAAMEPDSPRATVRMQPAARDAFFKHARDCSPYVASLLAPYFSGEWYQRRGFPELLASMPTPRAPTPRKALNIIFEEMNPDIPALPGPASESKIQYHCKIAGVLDHADELSVAFGRALIAGRFSACLALVKGGFDPWVQPAVTCPGLFGWGGARTAFLKNILAIPGANPNVSINPDDVPQKSRGAMPGIFQNEMIRFYRPGTPLPLLCFFMLPKDAESVERVRELLNAGADPAFAPPGGPSALDIAARAIDHYRADPNNQWCLPRLIEIEALMQSHVLDRTLKLSPSPAPFPVAAHI